MNPNKHLLSNYTTRESCRVCGSKNLTPLFSLGEQFVSDFVDKRDVLNGNQVPIDIELCNDCTLVQSKYTAPADILYKGTYWYRSGVTQTMRDALRDITKSIEERVELKDGNAVLDIGSNDGTLLRSYANKNLFKVGVEPAKNLVKEGRKGISVLLNDLWSYGLLQYHGLDNKQFKIISAIGMFYDLEDPNSFIRDISLALAPDGVFVAQLMCLKQTLERKDVGNFAHEHLEFYSLKSLTVLLHKYNLEIIEIEENTVNGGSYRIYARHFSNTPREYRSVIRALDQEEQNTSNQLRSFFQEIDRNRRECVQFVLNAVACGKTVWVYGASTKGNVILQWYGISNEVCPMCKGKTYVTVMDDEEGCGFCDQKGKRTIIQGAADRDPNKWGKYTVGTGISITSEEQFRAANPDFALLLPYSFLPEFVEREKEWRSRGGKFIIPLPEFKVI